jgi:hypothetical protein
LQWTSTVVTIMTQKLVLVITSRNAGTTLKIKNSDYGTYEGSVILINIEELISDYPGEDEFIEVFSTTVQHEFLHKILETIVPDKFLFGEEKTIRMVCGEDWDEEIESFYLKEAAAA